MLLLAEALLLVGHPTQCLVGSEVAHGEPARLRDERVAALLQAIAWRLKPYLQVLHELDARDVLLASSSRPARGSRVAAAGGVTGRRGCSARSGP